MALTERDIMGTRRLTAHPSVDEPPRLIARSRLPMVEHGRVARVDVLDALTAE